MLKLSQRRYTVTVELRLLYSSEAEKLLSALRRACEADLKNDDQKRKFYHRLWASFHVVYTYEESASSWGTDHDLPSRRSVVKAITDDLVAGECYCNDSKALLRWTELAFGPSDHLYSLLVWLSGSCQVLVSLRIKDQVRMRSTTPWFF